MKLKVPNADSTFTEVEVKLDLSHLNLVNLPTFIVENINEFLLKNGKETFNNEQLHLLDHISQTGHLLNIDGLLYRGRIVQSTTKNTLNDARLLELKELVEEQEEINSSDLAETQKEYKYLVENLTVAYKLALQARSGGAYQLLVLALNSSFEPLQILETNI